jgi:hypothetical protein
MRRTLLPLALALLSPYALADGAAPVDVLVDLGASGHDMEYDEARDRLYVSVPSSDKLVVVDTNNWQVVQEVTIAPDPHGVALSLDGTRLFVAKRGAGSVAVVDLATWTQSEILLTTELDSALTYDVVEATPDRLYVSANPGSGGFAYIVQVALDQGNVAQRVASNRIIRCNPTFEVSPDQTALYVGACFSPNSLYKLDLTQPDAPIIAEDDHGSVFGTWHLEASPDGSRVYLASGQVVESTGIQVVGQIGAGVSRFETDPTRIFVAVTPGEIQTWNVTTQVQVDSLDLPCSFSSIRELLVLPGETGFLVLGDTKLCGQADLPPCVAAVESYCVGAPNSAGPGATLSGIGEPLIATNAFGLALDGAPQGSISMFFYGLGEAQLPFGDGFLCLSPLAPGILRLPDPAVVDAQGHAERMLDFTKPPLATGPITSYSTWRFQAWYRDPAGPLGTGVNTSDALRVTFCP